MIISHSHIHSETRRHARRAASRSPDVSRRQTFKQFACIAVMGDLCEKVRSIVARLATALRRLNEPGKAGYLSHILT